MKIKNKTLLISPTSTSISINSSLKDRIKEALFSLFKNQNDKKKFFKNFTNRIDALIAKVESTPLRNVTNLFNDTVQTVQTKKQATEALKIINSSLRSLDLRIEGEVATDPDSSHEIRLEGNRKKAVLYNIRDKIDEKYITPTKSNLSVQFDLNPIIHTYPKDGELRESEILTTRL